MHRSAEHGPTHVRQPASRDSRRRSPPERRRCCSASLRRSCSCTRRRSLSGCLSVSFLTLTTTLVQSGPSRRCGAVSSHSSRLVTVGGSPITGPLLGAIADAASARAAVVVVAIACLGAALIGIWAERKASTLASRTAQSIRPRRSQPGRSPECTQQRSSTAGSSGARASSPRAGPRRGADPGALGQVSTRPICCNEPAVTQRGTSRRRTCQDSRSRRGRRGRPGGSELRAGKPGDGARHRRRPRRDGGGGRGVHRACPG